jgi:hypothetical protein
MGPTRRAQSAPTARSNECHRSQDQFTILALRDHIQAELILVGYFRSILSRYISRAFSKSNAISDFLVVSIRNTREG